MADQPYYLLNTFAERKKARDKAEKSAATSDEKAVDSDAGEVEDKAVAKKTTSRKRKS